MSKFSMLSYLLANGWKLVSQNYVSHEGIGYPVEISDAYLTQLHNQRIQAYEDARTRIKG